MYAVSQPMNMYGVQKRFPTFKLGSPLQRISRHQVTMRRRRRSIKISSPVRRKHQKHRSQRNVIIISNQQFYIHFQIITFHFRHKDRMKILNIIQMKSVTDCCFLVKIVPDFQPVKIIILDLNISIYISLITTYPFYPISCLSHLFFIKPV